MMRNERALDTHSCEQKKIPRFSMRKRRPAQPIADFAFFETGASDDKKNRLRIRGVRIR